LLSASPERFLEVTDGVVRTHRSKAPGRAAATPTMTPRRVARSSTV
jgi:hypothetical protein